MGRETRDQRDLRIAGEAGAAIGRMVRDARSALPPERRHPAEVTADRLLAHLEQWFDTTDGELRDEISHVRHWLHERGRKGGRSDGEGT